MTTITTLGELQALYGESHERSRRKELPHLIDVYTYVRSRNDSG